MVDKDQGLILMYPCIAEALAFKAALFDKPGPADFHFISANERRHFRELPDQSGVLISRHQWIQKKASSIAHYSGIGKFSAAYLNNYFSYCGYRYVFDPGLDKFPADITIVKLQFRVLIELQAEAGNYKAVFPPVFKYTVPVSEFTVGRPESTVILSQHIGDFHRIQNIFDLNTISSYVLYRSSSCKARDKGKILDPAPAMAHRIFHHIVPYFAGSYFQVHMFFILHQLDNPFAADTGYTSREVFGEQNIASASEDQHRNSFRCESAVKSSYVVIGMKFGKIPCFYVNAEGIIRFKGDVLEDLHVPKVKKLTLLWKPGRKKLMIKAIVTVTNDLTTDQRVHRSCLALCKSGYDVLLVGRQRKHSLPHSPRPYRMHRMKLSFDKGPLFYANYNIRLFFLLMMRRADLIVSNDADTIAGGYAALMIKRLFGSKVKMLHDCHEYFRGVPELVGRKLTTRIWKALEDFTFRKPDAVIAVNQSVADMYSREYDIPLTVIRNVPLKREGIIPADKMKYGIAPGQKVILYQGALNVDRGLEEAIQAMKFLRSDAKLIIAGTGDVIDNIRKFAFNQKVGGKVIFLGQLPFQELPPITMIADIGLSIEKDVSLNYHYALPNKFMDYIQAGVPVLISPFPEMKALVDKYFIGETIENHDPRNLASVMDAMLMNEERMGLYKQNCLKAAEDLCWENEEKTFLGVLEQINAS